MISKYLKMFMSTANKTTDIERYSKEVTELKGIVSSLKEKIDLLNQEVDVIQAQAAEKKKPFWKDPNLWVSASAVLISIVALGVTIQDSIENDKTRKKEELTKIVQSLVDLDYSRYVKPEYRSSINSFNSIRINDLDFLPIKDDERSLIVRKSNEYYYRRTQVLLENANNLVPDIVNKISFIEFLTLAESNRWITDYTRAEECHKRAISASEKSSSLNRAIAHRSFGEYYFLLPSDTLKEENLQQARLMFSKAIQILREKKDPNVAVDLGETYYWWANHEHYKGSNAKALKYIKRSQYFYNKLAEDDEDKSRLLNEVMTLEEKIEKELE